MFGPIKLTWNQASSRHQSSFISHIPRANTTSSNRIKAVYMAGPSPGPKFMVPESAAQSKYDSVSCGGLIMTSVFCLFRFFDPIKLNRNQASSRHQSSFISHIPRANTALSNRIKAVYMNSQVATSCSKKSCHEFDNVLKKRGSKKPRNKTSLSSAFTSMRRKILSPRL